MAKASRSARPKPVAGRGKAARGSRVARARPAKATAKPPARAVRAAKTTGAAKAPATVAPIRAAEARRSPVKKTRKPRFDKKTLASIREGLVDHRSELVVELEELEEAAFNASQSEMSGEVSYDEDYADAGSFTFEREKDLSIANNVQDLIDKIDRAIEKIDGGTYGTCEVCGQPIESARLKALPHALLCVRDKAAEERR